MLKEVLREQTVPSERDAQELQRDPATWRQENPGLGDQKPKDFLVVLAPKDSERRQTGPEDPGTLLPPATWGPWAGASSDVANVWEMCSFQPLENDRYTEASTKTREQMSELHS